MIVFERSEANSTHYSDNGKHLALSTSDLSIHILSSSTLSTIWRLKDAHAFPGTCLTFSPRGDMLVSGSADMSLRVIKVGVDEEPTIVHDWIHSGLISR
jgi:WD40 repeat protein